MSSPHTSKRPASSTTSTRKVSGGAVPGILAIPASARQNQHQHQPRKPNKLRESTTIPLPPVPAITQPSGRIAQARAERNALGDPLRPKANTRPVPRPPRANTRSSKQQQRTLRSNVPPRAFKPKMKPRDRGLRRQVEDEMRMMDLDVDMDVDALSDPEPQPMPTTPAQASSYTPPSSFPFASATALATPPHTPALSSSFTASSSSFFSLASPSDPSYTPEPRYANSIFQHSPSPKALPKPRFLDSLLATQPTGDGGGGGGGLFNFPIPLEY